MGRAADSLTKSFMNAKASPSDFSTGVRKDFGDTLNEEDARKKKEQEDQQAAAASQASTAQKVNGTEPSAWDQLKSFGSDIYGMGGEAIHGLTDMAKSAAESLGLKKNDGRWNK